MINISNGENMKIDYDKDSDILLITLKESKIKESDELGSGIIVDYDYDDKIVRIEILYASENVFPLNTISVPANQKFELISA